MLSLPAKNIIIKALKIRRDHGEEPKDILATYKNLTVEEKEAILKEIACE